MLLKVAIPRRLKGSCKRRIVMSHPRNLVKENNRSLAVANRGIKVDKGFQPIGRNGKIPTEAELSEKYGVSRITVRRAVDELVNQGLVEKKQGKGTFVTAPRFSRRLDSGPLSFSEMCEANGLVPGAKILETGIVIPKSASVREQLRLKDGESAVLISRLRTGSGKPLAYEESYYPMEYSDLLSIDLEHMSTYRYLREVRGIELKSTTIRLNIIKANAKMAKLLDVARNSALLEFKGCVVNGDGKPVHTSYQCGYGENFEFIIR